MKKNILIVDDSALMRKVMCDIITSDSTFQIADVCKDGLEAYMKLKSREYDAVVLDITMPRMDGLELLERLQRERIKASVIVVSTLTVKDADVTIRAMELGAIDFVTKPGNIIEAKGEDFKRQLLKVLRAVVASENAKNSLLSTPKALDISVSQKAPQVQAAKAAAGTGKKKLVALACSTGGPKALQSVIPYLPENMGAPMLLVQHMPVGFTKSMAERLDDVSKVRVKEAEEGDVLEKGCVYIAPGGWHMEVVKKANDVHAVHLSDKPAIGGLRPCANVTYESLRTSSYDQIVCVVLTGMGSDGTNGILSLREKKDIYVISQDAQSCVVYGMPKAIADTGIVNEVVPLAEVAKSIIKNVGVQ